MSALEDLAARYGTDKIIHGYIPYYVRHLDDVKHAPITLAEIGIWEGASLRMWRDWFTEATIVGIDKHDRDVKVDGVKIVIQEQDDEIGWNCLGELSGGFDVIIDDASHISSKTINTFRVAWPNLKDGGLYVIEDLQTSYDVINYTAREASMDPQRKTVTGAPTAMQFCKNLTDEINAGEWAYPRTAHRRLGYDVAAVHFYPNIVFIRKAY